MLDVDHTQGDVRVTGLAAPPQRARGNRDEITLIVNGRPVKDTALAQCLIEAYRPMLPRHQFPVAALLIDLPLPEVDVNVHPTKAWVRFRSPRLVQEAVFRAVQDALRSQRVVQPQQGWRTGRAPARRSRRSAVGPGEHGGRVWARRSRITRARCSKRAAAPYGPGDSARSSASSRRPSSSRPATRRSSSSTSTSPTSACSSRS